MNQEYTSLLKLFNKEVPDAVDFRPKSKMDSLRLVNLIGEERVDDFEVLGSHPSGSIVAKWRTETNPNIFPIVWLDSEGFPNSTFASSEEELLSLLPFSLSQIYDFITSWEYYYEDKVRYDYPLDQYPQELFEKILKENAKKYPSFNNVISWIKEKGLKIEKNPVELIGSSISKFPNLEAWLNSNL